MAAGAAAGAAWSFLFGSIPGDALAWCLVFLGVDYLTGTWAACHLGEWSSATGYKGLLKKLVILGCIALCNGLDTIFGTTWIVTAAIGAVSLTELGSVLENITRAGFGSAIPQVVRDLLQIAKDREQALIKSRRVE